MEKYMKRLVLIFALCVSIPTIAMEKPQDLIKNSLSNYAQAYSAAFGLTFMHEAGHWIAGKALLPGFKAKIQIHPLQILPLKGEILMNWNHGKSKRSPALKKRLAIMTSAGPLFGFAGAYALLKANTFWNEYTKKNKDVRESFGSTYHQPLFNPGQSLTIQAIAGFSLLQNWSNLYPCGRKEWAHLDGNKILKHLNIPNHPSWAKTALRLSLDSVFSIWLMHAIAESYLAR